MTTTTDTLAEFLLRQIEAEAAEAQAALDARPRSGGHWQRDGMSVIGDHPTSVVVDYAEVPVLDHIARHDPARVLAECAAKRKRVAVLQQWDALCAPDDWPEGDMSGAALADAGRHLLRIEALPYAGHPEFRDEWRA